LSPPIKRIAVRRGSFVPSTFQGTIDYGIKSIMVSRLYFRVCEFARIPSLLRNAEAEPLYLRAQAIRGATLGPERCEEFRIAADTIGEWVPARPACMSKGLLSFSRFYVMGWA
jgi:hypothetical protein